MAFYRWLAVHPLPPVLQAYWFLLMYFNNQSAIVDDEGIWYWPVEFNLPNTVVMGYLGYKDRFQVIHARKHLIAHALVHYQVHTGKRAGKYTLVPFDKGVERLWITSQKTGICTQVWTKKCTEAAPKSTPYINSINNKQTSLSHTYPEYSAHAAPERFHIPPALTADEKRRLEEAFPDKIERFWEAQRLRELKCGKNE